MQQYFVQGPVSNPYQVQDKDLLKHLFSVLRLQEGEQLIFVFDQGEKWQAKLTDRESALFELEKPVAADKELPVQVTLACAYPKGDKLELVAQKATELGVHQIWGFPGQWSVVKWDAKKLAKRQEKLRKVVLGAAEQSKRDLLPQVELLANQAELLERMDQFDHVLVAYEEEAKAGERSRLAQVLRQLTAGQKVLVLVGPEGGISPQEISSYQEYGAQLVGLGPRILRAETAPFYLLSAISYELELSGDA
ncbi:16S rRNA (uracil(1498)-N(3))-methyltransferase [Streptococcus sp. NLN64]|uniref:16S rRNA (uracil(1498)-N(3))-methyltransferase n=1 Tax=Streptococcus sp. NLN64 TaxID=2822799 RepID=UPI0018CAA5E0|nr:16S rRNA (uracil(1498)-N(3))-methyltransferase [Streptococcus sp. NLN64]MBG9366845.1 16S rRNA (uracil(1498)-N(3))-methyltransferase [Streptococcus sp. NLN64]